MITISEGLARIKLQQKKIEKEVEFVLIHTGLQAGIKDPLEKDGGQPEQVRRRLQAIKDMGEEILRIRKEIARANYETEVTIKRQTRSIADWLIWRREVAPMRKQMLGRIQAQIAKMKADAQRGGMKVVQPTGVETAERTDIVLNLSEVEIQEEILELEEILGTLDGILSAKNATIQIEG